MAQAGYGPMLAGYPDSLDVGMRWHDVAGDTG